MKAELLSETQMENLHDECNQLCNIIGKSIVTAKANQSSKGKR